MSQDLETEYLQHLYYLQRLTEAGEKAAHQTATSKYFPYQDNPVGFIEEVLGEFIWSRQKEIVNAVAKYRRVAVPSAHGVGKSFIAGRTVNWWLSCHPVGDAFAVTSAPTFNQVRAILWREIGKAHAKANLPGRTNQTEWLFGNELVGFGRKPQDLDMTAFQGIHARRVLVVMDEACGMPRPLWDAADSLITNDDSRILAIGNPDDPSSYFAEVCKPGSGWHVLPISVFDSPNLTGEYVPDSVKPMLTGSTWVEEKRKSWGEGSPLWQAKILGQFPDIADDSLISASSIRAAVDLWKQLEADGTVDPDSVVEIGVDIARFGNDETVIFIRKGLKAHIHSILHHRGLMQVAGAILTAVKEKHASVLKLDDAGLGGGVTDRLFELQEEGLFPADCEIIPVNVGAGASKKAQEEKFVNLRAELFWALRDRFQMGEIAIADDETTQGQLAAIKYIYDSRGRIQIEKKDDMKKRGLQSPDRADACMLCFAPKQLFELPAWMTRQHRSPKLAIFRR